MSGLLYYLPAGIKPEVFVAERERVFGRDPAISQRGVSGGPDGREGVVLAVGPREGSVAYLKDSQTWEKAPGADWWLGFDKANPPTPSDLARPEQLRGHAVRLGDDREWTIPTARLWIKHEGGPAPMDSLPQQLGMGEGGKLAMRPLPRYQWLSDTGLRIWTGLKISEKAISITLPVNDEWQIAVDALSVNYRVGPEEVTALGLITTANLVPVLLALVDFDGFMAVLEALEEAAAKKPSAGTSAGSDTASGETDSLPATPPASPT